MHYQTLCQSLIRPTTWEKSHQAEKQKKWITEVSRSIKDSHDGNTLKNERNTETPQETLGCFSICQGFQELAFNIPSQVNT